MSFKLLSVRFLIFFLGAYLLVSCGDAVRFEQPQPQGIGDLEKLPERYYGRFFSSDDSSNLVISANRVVVYRLIGIRLSRNAPEQSVKVEGNWVVDRSSGYRAQATIKGDSLELLWPAWTDTLYATGDKYRLRKYRGHFFLNSRKPDSSWLVRLLKPHSASRISIEELYAPDDIKDLREITPVKEVRPDSISEPEYLVNPGKRELNELMQRGFTTRAVYRRIRN